MSLPLALSCFPTLSVFPCVTALHYIAEPGLPLDTFPPQEPIELRLQEQATVRLQTEGNLILMHKYQTGKHQSLLSKVQTERFSKNKTPLLK